MGREQVAHFSLGCKAAAALFSSTMARAWYPNHRMGLSLSSLSAAGRARIMFIFCTNAGTFELPARIFRSRLLPMLVCSLGMHTFMQSAIVWRLPAGVIISLQGNKFVCKRWNGARRARAREPFAECDYFLLLKFPGWFNIVIQSTLLHVCNLIVPLRSSRTSAAGAHIVSAICCSPSFATLGC